MPFEAIWLRNAMTPNSFLHHFNLPWKWWSLKCRFCGCLINSELWFSLKLFFFFDLNYFYVWLLLFSCPTFILFFNFFLKIFATDELHSIFTIDVVHFFISSFIYVFAVFMFFFSYRIFSVHNFYDPYKWCAIASALNIEKLI